ncbi:MAG TPA: RNA polymerase sigma factor [Acidobacteriota bacterium]
MDSCLLEDLWARHQRLFRHIACAIVRDADIAEEVVQEAFRRALGSHFPGSSSEEALLYLKRIVTNTSIDYYHHGRRQALEDDLDQANRVADPPASSPLNQLLEQERQDLEKKRLNVIKREMTKLPPEQRFIIENLVLQESPATLTALSQSTGVPISTLRSRMILGLDRIRESLRKEGLWGVK